MNSREIKSLDIYVRSIKCDFARERVQHLLHMYAKKATFYKRMFYILSIATIIINTGIPVINQLNLKYSSVTVSALSAIASIITSVIALFSAKDTWYRYRKHAELIKRECMLFSCQYGDYEDENREKVFTSNIEKIVDGERAHWENYKIGREDKKKNENDKPKEDK